MSAVNVPLCTLSAVNFIKTCLSSFYCFSSFSFIYFICSLEISYLWVLSHLLTRFYQQTADQYQSNIATSQLTVLDCTDYSLSAMLLMTNLKLLKYLVEQKHHYITSIIETIQSSTLGLQATLDILFHSQINFNNQFANIPILTMNSGMVCKSRGAAIIMHLARMYNDFKSRFLINRTSNINICCLSYIFIFIYFSIFSYD